MKTASVQPHEREHKLFSLIQQTKTLTKFIILSMTAITAYTAVLIWLRVEYGFWIDTEFSKLWYGFWGSEIFIAAGLKSEKMIFGRTNPFTGKGGSNTGLSDGDDAVG